MSGGTFVRGQMSYFFGGQLWEDRQETAFKVTPAVDVSDTCHAYLQVTRSRNIANSPVISSSSLPA